MRARFPRMAARLAAAGAVVLALHGCSAAPSRDGRTGAALEATVRAFSTALAAGDTLRLRELAADRFVLLEDGEALDLTGTIRSLGPALARGEMHRALSPLSMERRGDLAWGHWTVDGRIAAPGETLAFVRLESAVLEKTDGRWRIAQLTSMRTSADTSR